ncbi:MAG: histidine kinase N-terminal 7TM domain-containing protein [Chloroflexota bacterium]
MFEVIRMLIVNMGLVIYVAMAAYVLAHNPKRPINRVFALFALTYGVGYFAFSLLLKGQTDSETALLLLRGRYVVGIFTPTAVLHLLTFYFPKQWVWLRRVLLGVAYLLTIVFVALVLGSSLIIESPFYFEGVERYAVNPGLLTPFYVGYTVTAVAAGLITLIVAYVHYSVPTLRRQIRSILFPTGLTLFFIGLGAIIIFTHNAFLAQFISLPFILPGIFYANAVLRYGSFTGRPIARRELYFAIISLVVMGCAVLPTIVIDRWLWEYTQIRQFVASNIVAVFLLIVFPAAQRWLLREIDRWLAVTSSSSQLVAARIGQALADVPDVNEMQQTLLRTLCETLGIDAGVVVEQQVGGDRETAVITYTYGQAIGSVGTVLPIPFIDQAHPYLLASVSPSDQIPLARQGVELIFPITHNDQQITMLVLGQKKNGKYYSQADMELCETLVEQMRMAVQIGQLQREQEAYLQAAYDTAEKAKRLSEQVATLDAQSVMEPVAVDRPLTIQVLGVLAIHRDTFRVPDAAWGSEKAKAMLAYLIWKGTQGATREELATAIWTERSLEESANTFHVTLHNLRNVLEVNRGRRSRYIVYKQNRYYFDLQPGDVLDCDRFEQLCKQGTAESLDKAIALYRGDYMADMVWALPAEVEVKRRHLERLYENALRRRAQEADDQQQAEMLWQKLLVLIPVDTEANTALIQSYLTRGYIPQAQRQVQRWQQALQEMGIMPTPQIEAVWRQVPQ